MVFLRFFCHYEPRAGVIGSLPRQTAIFSRFLTLWAQSVLFSGVLVIAKSNSCFFKVFVALVSPKRIVFWALPRQTAIFSVSPKCIDKSNCYVFQIFGHCEPNMQCFRGHCQVKLLYFPDFFCHCEPKVHCFPRHCQVKLLCSPESFCYCGLLAWWLASRSARLRVPLPLHPFLGVFLLPLSSLCMLPSRVIPSPPPSVGQRILRSLSKGCHGLQWCWSKSPESSLWGHSRQKAVPKTKDELTVKDTIRNSCKITVNNSQPTQSWKKITVNDLKIIKPIRNNFELHSTQFCVLLRFRSGHPFACKIASPCCISE